MGEWVQRVARVHALCSSLNPQITHSHTHQKYYFKDFQTSSNFLAQFFSLKFSCTLCCGIAMISLANELLKWTLIGSDYRQL